MALSSDARRRWLGVICLAIAAVMLILGQTVLKDSLRRQAFIYYWLACTVITGLTLVIALLDMRAVRLRSQREQKELLKDVFREITEDKDKKAHSPGKN
jgi:Na+/melibiose symporter-like transporter